MSISVYKTFSAGEVLTAADLNSSLTQIVNNGTDVAFPLTKNVSAGGFGISSLALGTSATDAANVTNANVLNMCEFRLTLTSGTPVTTADVSAVATLYWTPYRGNRVALYDGTNWNMRTSAEISTPSNALTALPYDVFVYDNATVPTLEVLVWTNDTTRATALALQNGVLVKSGAATRRYVGTIRVTGASQLQDTYAARWVWNYYNRALRPMRSVLESTATWNYTTATVRQANANAANQLDFVIGVGEDMVFAQVLASALNVTVSTAATVGIGLDSTTAFAATCIYSGLACEAQYQMTTASLNTFPGVGRHYLTWLEWSAAAGTTTWRGQGASIVQTGIYGEIMG